MSNDGKSKFNNSYSEPLFMEAESQDTCFTDDWLWSIDFYIEEFIKGFGGPYYFTWSMGDFQMNRERALKYYKKNDVEWGTPFDLTVNIKQLKQKGSFNIYPIPAKDYVLIKRGDLEIKHVNIYDITGNLIKSFNFNKDADEIRLNISNFESGVYWVKIGDRIKKMVVY